MIHLIICMKRNQFCLLLACLLMGTGCEEEETDLQGNWVQVSPIEGETRGGAVAFVLNDQAYVGTGYDGEDRLANFWRYDPANGTWQQVADFGGTPRNYAVAFVAGGKGYVGTGLDDDDEQKDFWEYDPASNRWARKADFGGAARYLATSFTLNDQGYVGTGYTGSYVSDFWRFNPTDASLGIDEFGNPLGSWTQIRNFAGGAPNPKRRGAVSFVIGSTAYVGTGESNGASQDDFYAYNAETDQWTEIEDLEDYARSNAVAFTLNGKGYVATGSSGAGRNDVWEYDPAVDTWTERTEFEGSARAYAVGFAISSIGFVGTGGSGSGYDDFWEFRPLDAYDDED